jgi:uncharacterized protein DUF2586
MPNPEVNVTVSDGALGQSENSDEVSCKVGTCSAGAFNTLFSFSRPEAVRSTLGQGGLVEALCDTLDAGGGTVVAMRINGSVAGSNSAVVRTGTSPDPGMTLTGTPFDAYQGTAKITKGGTLGVFEFQISFDGGDTYSDVILSAASITTFAATTGLTLAFAAGTYVLNDTYTFTSTAPYFNTTDLNTTFAALLANPTEWGFVHVVGRGANAADTAGIVAAVQSQLATAATNFRFVRGIVEASDDTDANLISGLAATSAIRVNLAAGFSEMQSKVSGRVYKRSAGTPVATRAHKVGRLARVRIARHLGCIKDGALDNVASLYRDEDATPALDPQRMTTLRSIKGKQGKFITRGRLMAPSGSDYKFWHTGRVIDKACRLGRLKLLDFLNDTVLTKSNGTIVEREALRIEKQVDAVLRDQMVNFGEVTEVTVRIDRTVNIQVTQSLLIDIRVRQLGYMENIDLTVGLEIPISSLLAA